MITSKWFSETEFNICDPSCSLQDMNQDTINRLDNARSIAGIPFLLSSAKRSKEWDIKFGRSGTGSHTEGKAVDIKCNSSMNRFLIVSALLKAGFTRIGIAKTFIHADDSERHGQKVVWLY